MRINLWQISPLLMLTFVFLVGCRGTIPINGNPIEGSNGLTYQTTERDEATVFYRELYPITAEIHQVAEDWNTFFTKAVKHQTTLKDVGNGAKQCQARLEALYIKLASLKPTSKLQILKNDVKSVLDTGTATFGLYYEGLTNNQSQKVLEADNKIQEMNRMIAQVAREWDEGAAFYNINPLDIRY